MYFHDVTQGAPWQPESAARYNAVNQLLSRADLPQTVMLQPGSSNNRLLVRNASNATLNIFTAISPKIPQNGIPADFSPEERAWDVLPAADETYWWGILQQELAPQQCGEAVIGGITLAKMNPASTQGNKRYVAPGTNGLEYQNSGRGELLGVLANDPFALICLYHTVPYDGVFKLTKTATGVSVGAGVAVVNGTVYEVAASTLTCSGAGWVYLSSTSGAAPVAAFSSTKPAPGGTENAPTGVFPLGKVTAAGAVTQLCRSVPQLIVIGTDCTDSGSGSGSAS